MSFRCSSHHVRMYAQALRSMTPCTPLAQASSAAVFDREKLPKHVAFIMDGNRRWADSRGMPKVDGHRKGIETLVEIVKVGFQELKIPYMTIYAFSEENNERPKEELKELFGLFGEVIKRRKQEILGWGVQIKIIGHYQEMDENLSLELTKLMEQTAEFKGGMLTVALNYSGRTEIIDAVKAIIPQLISGKIGFEDLSWEDFQQYLYTGEMPDPDLLIRTSGEYRLSNFLIAQVAYSELYFTPVLWPDFTREEFIKALMAYGGRERRFGKNLNLIKANI